MKVVKTDVYERDGVEYEINVIFDEGTYWGKWSCTQCGEGGESSKECDAIEDAITAAKTNLSGHHWSSHRQRA